MEHFEELFALLRELEAMNPVLKADVAVEYIRWWEVPVLAVRFSPCQSTTPGIPLSLGGLDGCIQAARERIKLERQHAKQAEESGAWRKAMWGD